ncbi:MAG TPA: sodium:solute symporter family protein [Verrucomicrobiae bacterium]|nr:sodium:solute symporter family protein [Verrucomicrobiae bacterium]
MTTQSAILIGVGIDRFLMLAVSLFWMRRVKNPTDYLIGGRSLPFWVLAGNITAGCIGTGVIIGGSGLAYKHGWAGCAYPIGLGLGTLAAGAMFAVMRRYKFMTLSEEVASYYSGNRVVVEFSNITLFLSQLCWLTVQIMGGASVLVAVTNLPVAKCVIAAGIISASVTIPGGFKSVVYADFLQAIILLTGFGVVTSSALHHANGLEGLRQSVPAAYFSFLGVDSYGSWKIFGLIVALGFSVVADPGRRSSMYSALSETGARWSMVCAGIIVMIFSVVIGVAGMYAYQLNPHLPVPDEALLWLVMHVLPVWLAALVVVSVTSGIFSCASSNAMSVGTFFVRHIYPLATGGKYPARPLLVTHCVLVCAFVVSTVIALHAGAIVSFVVKFLPVTMSGLAVIILLGRFWKRSTWQGAVAALVTTPAISLGVMFLLPDTQIWNNAIIPTAAGAIVHVLVSAMTPPATRSFAEVAASMTAERQSIEGNSSEIKLSGQPSPTPI